MLFGQREPFLHLLMCLLQLNPERWSQCAAVRAMYSWHIQQDLYHHETSPPSTVSANNLPLLASDKFSQEYATLLATG